MAEEAQVRLDRAHFVWESRQFLHWLLPGISCITTYLIMAAPSGGHKRNAAVALVSTSSGMMITPTWWFTRPTWPRWSTATPRPLPPAEPKELQVDILAQHFEVIPAMACSYCVHTSTAALWLLVCNDACNLLYALQTKRTFGYLVIISCSIYGTTAIAMVLAECFGQGSSCHLLSWHGSTSTRSVLPWPTMESDLTSSCLLVCC